MVTILIWFAANRFLDESPGPQRDALLVSSNSSLPDDKNIAVGLLGLGAPKGTDFLQYGSKVKALYASNAPWEQINELIRGPATLRPTVVSDQVNCWLDPDAAAWPGCLPFADAPAVLLQNRELLDRYKALYSLDDYAGIGSLVAKDPYLVILYLSIAEMYLDLRQHRYEDAYRKWRDQFLFIRRALRGPDNWVGKAVGLVAIGMTMSFLEPLLQADPTLAKTHAAELLEMLRSEGMAGFNPDGIARQEYAMLDKYLMVLPDNGSSWQNDKRFWLAYHTGQRNRIMNRYVVFSQEHALALGLSWREADQELDRLRDKYRYSSEQDYLMDPFGSLFIDYYIGVQLKGRELLKQMHSIDGRMRLATLLVRIINEQIDDAGIADFLASLEPNLRDPFSGSPMRWDPKDRKIYFLDPTDKCNMRGYIQIPNLHQPVMSPPPKVDWRIC